MDIQSEDGCVMVNNNVEWHQRICGLVQSGPQFLTHSHSPLTFTPLFYNKPFPNPLYHPYDYFYGCYHCWCSFHCARRLLHQAGQMHGTNKLQLITPGLFVGAIYAFTTFLHQLTIGQDTHLHCPDHEDLSKWWFRTLHYQTSIHPQIDIT